LFFAVGLSSFGFRAWQRNRNLLYFFEDFVLDCDRRELRQRDGGEVALQPQVFDLLEYLIRQRERVVTKDNLIAAIWGGRIVSESALTTRINAARIAIGDSGEQQRLIRTLPRKGIRFVGTVQQKQNSADEPDRARAAPVADSDARHQLLGLKSLHSATDRGPDSSSDPAPSDKPSIAVLPFQNLSGDPEQEYFADGMVEEIITGLSRIKWLSVISRNSTFNYKSKPVAIGAVAERLGVRYVLEGSVRKSASRIRIAAQLIDAQTGAYLLAEQYDRVLEDIFVVQDEIAMHVVGAIEPGLRKAELNRVKRRRPDNLNAYDLVLRSLPLVFAQMPKDAAIAIPLLENAVKLQPDYGAAHAFLGWCLHHRFARGGSREDDRVAAIQHARAAIACGSDDATALAVAAQVIARDGHDSTTALKLFDRALELSNSNIFSLSLSASNLAWLGESELAMERAKRAIQLSPFDPFNYRPYYALAIAHFFQQQYEEGVDAARTAINYNPAFSNPRAILVAALWRAGRAAEAKVAKQELLECEPTFTVLGFVRSGGFESAVFESFADAWREIGLPD
jgi:TolB-like protein